MVKIMINKKQITDIFKWNEFHKDIVRKMLIPFEECSLMLGLGENDGFKANMRISVSKEDDNGTYKFKVSNIEKREIEKIFTYNIFTYRAKYIFNRDDKEKAEEDVTPSFITLWAATMAYIVNYKNKVIKYSHKTNISNNKNQKDSNNNKNNSVIYLNSISYIYDKGENESKRKYTPCENAFHVRGHYRRMKSGKVVYVRPYEKNVGKAERTQTFNIGDIK